LKGSSVDTAFGWNAEQHRGREREKERTRERRKKEGKKERKKDFGPELSVTSAAFTLGSPVLKQFAARGRGREMLSREIAPRFFR
jgi:hypothetical protein